MAMGSVAETILNQLGGAARVSAMLGVTQFAYEQNALRIKFKAGNSKVGNVCRIALDPTDTYTVEFFYQRGLACRELGSDSLVYADSLRRVFEDRTGLRLSL